jgi:lycopene beta-cyclase
MIRALKLPTTLHSLHIPREDRLYWLLVILWVLSMISVPIQLWIGGMPVLPFALTLTVVIQAAATMSVLLRGWGWRRTAVVVGAVLVMGWLVEFVGSRTGFPFGIYHYTASLQPQILSVPLIIPLAWLMMLPASWAVAACLVGTTQRWRFILVSALAMTAWDLYLDPQKVAWGMWVWPGVEGGYFGIPWSNYAGWLLTTAVMTFIVRPRDLPLIPLLVIYGITWILQAIGLGVFWGQPGPAVVGFLGMGILLSAALYRRYYRSSPP